MTTTTSQLIDEQIAARRKRASKVEAADIERTRNHMLAIAKRLGIVGENVTVSDILAQPMPTVETTVVEPWHDPESSDDMTDGEAFIAWNESESSHVDLRRRAANEVQL